MSELPLVSVITPSYDSAHYISETIESVKMQDYPAVEHIVIDGNSTDGTQKILASYPHLIWISEPDRGQSDALNKGFKRARGEIVGWLNADDLYRPGAISTGVNFLLEHEDVDLIYSDLQVIDENGTNAGVTKAQPFDLKTFILLSYIKQPTVFMRRHVIDKLGGVDERYHYVMDRELWLRAGMAGFKLQNLPGEVLASFRLCPGTKSFEQTPQFRLEWLQVLEKAFQDSALSRVPADVRQNAWRKTSMQYHIACMLQAIEQHDRKMMFVHLARAAIQDWSILKNRGTWFFVGKGLVGSDINRLRKFSR